LNGSRQPPEVMQVELASLIHLLGGMAPKHLVAVGGLVPPLLVPEPRTPHRGSADIDLSVSMAITKGETSEYYRSLEAAIEPFFEPFEAGFRWRKRDGVAGVGLLVDFMGPDAEATHLEDGTLGLEDPVAAANTGAVLRLFPLSAAAIVEEDAQSAEIERVPLAGGGRGVDNRLPGLQERVFPGERGQAQGAFKEATYVGPSGYAKEMNPTLEPGAEAYERDRNGAYLRVSRVLGILRGSLWE
jgi:hypothetical protein